MKLTIVAMEIPYPPNHGGRVDIWRRIKALKHVGVKLQLVCWTHQLPTPEERQVIDAYVEDFYPIVYGSGLGRSLRRAVDLLSYPLDVTSRIVRGQEWRDLLNRVQQFSPDVIMADHIHSCVVGQPLSKALNRPLTVRSHDIEHLHYGYWMKSSKGMAKFKRRLSLNHLKAYEFSMLRQSARFYDISLDDLNFWRAQGLENGQFLPPVIDIEGPERQEPLQSEVELPQEVYDVVFLGNLRTDNNVAGVLWFLSEVLPLLQIKLPEIKVLIAGSSPTKDILTTCEQTPGVTLKANPVSAAATYQSGKVLINPVATGSGTSIKSIDMLILERPIVTLEKGLFGLPEAAKQYFKVATDAQSFAQLIIESLSAPSHEFPDPSVLSSLFGRSVIEGFVADLEGLCNSAGVRQR